jgi:DNA-binding LacI/PurR family transcriptional regulator
MPSSQKNRLRMVDVADRAGCSQSAVSHVLTGSGKGCIRVSEETAEKIRQVAKELDFQPSYAARMLRGKHTGVLGMISSHWQDHTQLRVFSWVQQVTAANGYQVLTAQASTTEESKKTIREFHSRGITEVLCFAGRGALRELDAFEVLGQIPTVVSIFGSVPIEHSVYVDVDWAEGSRQAVRHLSNCGRRRIGMIVEVLESPISRARCDGFLDAHSELNLDLEDTVIIGGAEDLL